MAGEELVAYATGLGETNPALTTGQPAAQSSPTVTTFGIDFNYRANALATQPGAVGVPPTAPLFTGATKATSASTRSTSSCRRLRREYSHAWISRRSRLSGNRCAIEPHGQRRLGLFRSMARASALNSPVLIRSS